MNSVTQGHLQLATAIRQGPPLSEEDLQHVDRNVQLLYESDYPFFTRQTLHRIGHEFAQAAKDNTTRIISLTGLDGVTIEFELKIETADMAIEEDLEYFAQYACLLYLTPRQLAFFSRNDPITAYSNIRIVHQMVSQRSIQSNMDISNHPSRDKVYEILSRSRQTWEVSEQWKQLKDLLARKMGLESVKKIIGIGLGALSGGGTQSSASRSAYQHALLLTLRDTLTKPQDERHIPCYIQDPAYSTVDKAVLNDLGFTVLEDPNGFVEIDENSAVISLYPDCPVKEIVFDLAKPALIIWKTVKYLQSEDNSSTEQHTPSTTSSNLVADPDGPRVRESIRSYYDELGFPTDENFADVSVYIKRKIPSS